MTSINLNDKERKDLITQMKQETKPSRRLRMHVVLLVADKLKPAEIATVLYCSRTTVYAVTERFSQQKEKAFDDQTPRGPAPALDASACQRFWRHWWNRKLHASMVLIAPDGPVQC